MNQLVAKAKAGDKKAKNELFQYLFIRFNLFAKRKVREDKDAEDLAQEACMTIIEKYKTEKFTVNFQAWAYGVLKMKIGNYLQSKKRLSGKQTSFDEIANPIEAKSPDFYVLSGILKSRMA